MRAGEGVGQERLLSGSESPDRGVSRSPLASRDWSICMPTSRVGVAWFGILSPSPDASESLYLWEGRGGGESKQWKGLIKMGRGDRRSWLGHYFCMQVYFELNFSSAFLCKAGKRQQTKAIYVLPTKTIDLIRSLNSPIMKFSNFYFCI